MVAQEDAYSCGAACARQLLLDVGIVKAEADIRTAAGFVANVGIYAEQLARTLTNLDPSRKWATTSLDPNELDTLMRRAPFIAMLKKHWVIIDGYDSGSGALKVRDPEPLSLSSYGTACLIARSRFDEVWTAGAYQVVFRVK